jgi:hypothetical protein
MSAKENRNILEEGNTYRSYLSMVYNEELDIVKKKREETFSLRRQRNQNVPPPIPEASRNTYDSSEGIVYYFESVNQLSKSEISAIKNKLVECTDPIEYKKVHI